MSSAKFDPPPVPTRIEAFAAAARRRHKLPLIGELSVSEALGHTSFLLAGAAWGCPDILNLRMLSVSSGAATLFFTFFHPVGKPLWIPFGWNIVFMVINLTHISGILAARWEAENLPEQALELYRQVFATHALSQVEFARLLHAGTWTTFRSGSILQEEGQPSNSLFLIVQGGAEVHFEGRHTHNIRSHQFVGDMGISSGIAVPGPVTGVARVETTKQTTCLVWRRQLLHELMQDSPELANAMQAAVSADVVRKLQDPDTRVGDPDMWQRMWRARYGSVLKAVLDEGKITPTHRQQLSQFRDLHQVTEQDHQRILEQAGWTVDQFEVGERPHAAPGAEGRAARQSRKRLSRSATKLIECEQSPLALWDARKHLVASVQERLNAFFDTDALEVDGEYGPLTQQAVELFQSTAGLKVCGRVGPATWGALRTVHRSKLESELLLSVVRGYDEKLDVETALLQRKLQIVLGDDCVTADGNYGPRTRLAVERFLKDNNIKGTSGDISQLTPHAVALLRERHLVALEQKALCAAEEQAATKLQTVPVTNQDIKLLQLVLNQVMGRKMVLVDGIYGPNTKAAISEFRQTYGLPAEGDVGEQLQVVTSVLREEAKRREGGNPVASTSAQTYKPATARQKKRHLSDLSLDFSIEADDR